MEFSLPLPPQLDQSGIVYKQWNNFLQRFNYHKNTYKDSSASILLFAARLQVSSIYESMKMIDVDVTKLNKILEIVEKVCLPQFILLFERFRYFTLEQETSETLNDFIHVLRKQVEMCEFGDLKLKDSIMTNALVNGVIDENFKLNLQNSGGLCFDEAVSMCSASANANVSASASKAMSVGDINSLVSKSKKIAKGKRKATVPTYKKNMYIMPVYDSINEDADADDHVVETVTEGVKKSRTRRKAATKPPKNIPKQFLCYNCDNEYATRKSFRRHIASKHGDHKNYYCKHCKMTFNNRTECITHCRGHSTTPAATSSTSHWKKTDCTDYACWYCELSFPNLPEYKVHCATHLAVRVFHCDLCQKKNHNITRMIGHLKGHLVPRHKCEICGNCFGRAELLAAHLQTHADKPLHQCQVCGKSFVSADRLHCHMRTHSGEKRFTCELCGKSFSQKMSFDYHKRWHAGEKPYECDICGRRTISFGDLRKHKRMHSDRRPYVCEVCGKSFRFISNLNRHRQGHSGKRSHVCNVCGRTFIYGEGLRDHIKAGRCPGTKKDGVTKSSRAPRMRGPSVPNSQVMPLMDNNPPPFAAPHQPPETLQNEFAPWQYMIRNNEAEGTSGFVLVPPFY